MYNFVLFSLVNGLLQGKFPIQVSLDFHNYCFVYFVFCFFFFISKVETFSSLRQDHSCSLWESIRTDRMSEHCKQWRLRFIVQAHTKRLLISPPAPTVQTRPLSTNLCYALYRRVFIIYYCNAPRWDQSLCRTRYLNVHPTGERAAMYCYSIISLTRKVKTGPICGFSGKIISVWASLLCWLRTWKVFQSSALLGHFVSIKMIMLWKSK